MGGERVGPGEQVLGRRRPESLDDEQQSLVQARQRLEADNLFPGIWRSGGGVSMPEVLFEVKPRYTRETASRRVEGTVVMACVVLDDGSVGAIRVIGGLDPELDAEAVSALRRWRFRPAQRDGRPAPVQVTVGMSFAMK